MRPIPICRVLAPVGLLLALAACGGGGSPPPYVGPAPFSRTLAYVVTECHQNAQEWRFHQALQIQHGEAPPVPLAEFDFGPFPQHGNCTLFGFIRDGVVSLLVGSIQRLGLSPDGATVVFEITDDFSLLHLPEWGGVEGSLLPEEQKGFFSVHTDGSGLRRLGPASREATWRDVADPNVPGGQIAWVPSATSLFSPDGRLITFTDLGPGPNGEEAIQIFVMDVVSGTRTQLTSLPPLAPIIPYWPGVFPGFFLDNETIQFNTFAVMDVSAYTLKVQTRELTARAPIAIPGSVLVPNLSITGLAANVFSVYFTDRTPVNQLPNLSFVEELFVASGTNLLQLTSFHRSDTGLYGSVLSPDRRRVLFTASADPFGRNPYENCQVFSIDTLGGDLRQLTAFNEGDHSVGGCVYPYPPGCLTYFLGADAATDSVLLYSSCDPQQRNPYGQQFFAMHFDGSGLRQLSAFKGMVTEADGTVTVELPGPIAPSSFVDRSGG